MATTRRQIEMNIMREINQRKISLTPALGSWLATRAVVKAKKKLTPAQMEIVEAFGRTAEEAVIALCEKLDARAEQKALFEMEEAA